MGEPNFLQYVGEKTWWQVGTLLTGTHQSPLLNANVVFNEKSILFVGDSSSLPPKNLLKEGQESPDLSLPDYTLLPGLIEAHAHLFLEGAELDFDTRKQYLKKKPEELFVLATKRLEKLVRIGVTAYRDAGDNNGVGLQLSKLYGNANRPLMPYVDSPGAAIHHKGRYGSFMSEPLENYSTIRECVEGRIAAGADRIKLIPTGIINFKEGRVTKEPQMTSEEMIEFVKVSKELGKQTFAHASGDIGIDVVIDGGADSVEHGFFLRDDQLNRMRDKDIAWVPTFAPVQKQVDFKDKMGWDENIVSNLQKILDLHASNLVKAEKKGVKVIAGSDAGSYGVAHGVDFLYELELMEAAGISPISVINSATGVSSDRLGYKENFGQIKKGFKSRFILTKNSPLDKISNLRLDKHVVFDGQILESKNDMDYSGL